MDKISAILDAHDVHRTFPIGSRTGRNALTIRAVRGVSLRLERGANLALVGESGCGKSTLANMLLGLSAPTLGRVDIRGMPTASLSRIEIARTVQPVFQDPYVSLNPSKTVEQIVQLPLQAAHSGTRNDQRGRVHAMLEMVGLPVEFASRMPRQLSGGQRQRVAIARALVSEPRALICDEPTSALDVSVQAQIINLLLDLRERLGLSYLLITHNLAVVDRLAERTAVMYFGRLVEEGTTRAVLDTPMHPYTLVLRQAVLEPNIGQVLVSDAAAAVMPNPMADHVGCPFRARCNRALPVCQDIEPDLAQVGDRRVACHNPIPQ